MLFPIQKYLCPSTRSKEAQTFPLLWGSSYMEKGKKKKKKSQNRVQIIYSIFHSVMFLKQRQNTYNYTLWTLFGDNIKNLNLRPSKEY